MARVTTAVETAAQPLTGIGNTRHALPTSTCRSSIRAPVIDVPAERERLTKDLAKYEKGQIQAG